MSVIPSFSFLLTSTVLLFGQFPSSSLSDSVYLQLYVRPLLIITSLSYWVNLAFKLKDKNWNLVFRTLTDWTHFSNLTVKMFQCIITSQQETLVRIYAGTLVTSATQTGKSHQSHDEGNSLFLGSPSLSGVRSKAIITSGSKCWGSTELNTCPGPGCDYLL